MGGGGKGGGSSPNINVQPSPYEQTMAGISQQYYQNTEPIRSTFFRDFQSFLNPSTTAYYPTYTSVPAATGGAAASAAPAMAVPSIEDISRQLTQARSGQMGYGSAEPYFKGMGVDLTKYFPAQDKPDTDWNLIARNIRDDVMARSMNQQAAAGATPGTGGAPGGQVYRSQGGYDPYKLPAFQPIYNMSRVGIEDQYRIAKQNIIGQTPQGGALSKALSDLERSRAYDVGALPAQIATPLIQDIYNKAYGMATSAPQVSLSGLGAASSTASQRATAQASLAQSNALAQQQMANSMWGGLGSGLGALGAAAMLK